MKAKLLKSYSSTTMSHSILLKRYIDLVFHCWAFFHLLWIYLRFFFLKDESVTFEHFDFFLGERNQTPSLTGNTLTSQMRNFLWPFHILCLHGLKLQKSYMYIQYQCVIYEGKTLFTFPSRWDIRFLSNSYRLPLAGRCKLSTYSLWQSNKFRSNKNKTYQV